MRLLLLLCLLSLSGASVALSDDAAVTQTHLEQELAVSRNNSDGMGHWAEDRRLWLAVVFFGTPVIAIYCWALWRKKRMERLTSGIHPDQYKGSEENFTPL